MKFDNPNEITGKQYIQGYVASSYEVNVARALDTCKIQYIFQYTISEGYRRRGGQVLDFLAFTKPKYTPIEVNGDYWHRDKTVEFYLEVETNRILKSYCFPLVIFWGEDSKNYEDALRKVRRTFK